MARHHPILTNACSLHAARCAPLHGILDGACERAPWRGLSESQAQPACRRVIQEGDRYPAQTGPPRLASEEVRPCDRQAANRDRLSQLSRHFSIGHNRDQVERSLVIPSLGCRLNVARTAEG